MLLEPRPRVCCSKLWYLLVLPMGKKGRSRKVEQVQTGAASSQEPSELSDSRSLRKKAREHHIEMTSQVKIAQQFEAKQERARQQMELEEQAEAEKAAGDRSLCVPALVRFCRAQR